MALTLRRVLYGLLLLGLIAAIVVFAYANPDRLSVDLGFAKLDDVSIALFAVCAFALGWLAGLVSAGYALLRMATERRRRERQLQVAEAELRTLRSLPMHDAN